MASFEWNANTGVIFSLEVESLHSRYSDSLILLRMTKTPSQPQLGFILALRVKQRASTRGFGPAGLTGLQTRHQRSLLSQASVTFG